MSEQKQTDDHRLTHRTTGVVGAAVMMLGSSYVEMVFGLVRGILVMNFIGPTGRGIMRLVDMAHKYLTHTHLGTLHGLSKELPIAIGRQDTEQADEIESVVGTFVTVTGMLAGLGMFAYGFFSRLGSETRFALMLGGGLLVTQQVYALYRCVLRAWGRFSVLASASVLSTVMQFVLIVGGAKWMGVNGAMLGWLIASAVGVLYFRFASRFVIPVRINWPKVWQMMLSGLPIALILFADTLLRTVDGVAVLSAYPTERAYQFGLYSVAMQMSTYLYRIPEAGGFVIMPRILESYAAKGDVAGVRRQVMLPTIASATIMPIAAGCAFLLMPPLVRAVIPKFEPVIYATQVLSLASVLLALPVATNGLLIALNREILVVANKAAGAAIIYVLAYWYASHNGSLSTIAMAAGVGFFVSSIMSLTEVFGRYYESKLELLTQLLLCYAPLAWCIIALRASGMVLHAGGTSLLTGWPEVIARLAIFLVLMAPVAIYGNSRTNLVMELKRAVLKTVRRDDKSGPGKPE